MSGSVKVPADWFERDDVDAVGAEVAMFHLAALAYSARQLTDGAISRRQAHRLWADDDLGRATIALESVGWWEPVEDGWQIQDWNTFILSGAEVDKIREEWRTRQERKRRHDRGDHSMCDRCWWIRAHKDEMSRSESPRESRRESLRESRPSDPNRTEPKVRGSEAGDEAGPDGYADPSGPPADGTPFVTFMRAPKQLQAAAQAAARAELGPDADPAAVIKRAAELLANGEVH